MPLIPTSQEEAASSSTSGLLRGGPRQHEEHQWPSERYPFAYSAVPDPFTEGLDSVLKGPKTDPLVVHTHSASEYWQHHGYCLWEPGRVFCALLQARTGSVPPPQVGKLYDGARCCSGLQKSQRIQDNAALLLRLMRLAQGMPVREADVYSSRGHGSVLKRVEDGNGGNALSLYGALNQSDGPLARRSIRCEEHSLHPLLFHTTGHLRSGDLAQMGRVGDVPGEGVVSRS
jgi:hypothetical protein